MIANAEILKIRSDIKTFNGCIAEVMKTSEQKKKKTNLKVTFDYHR